MTSDLQEFRAQFFALIEKSKNVVITAHMSPDDDSIASVMSVFEILTEKYPDKKIRILYSGSPVGRWNSFAYFKYIEFVDDIAHHVNEVDTLIALDGSNSLGRFSKLPEQLETIPHRITIDHHASVLGPFTLALVVPTSTSNAELIYHALIEGSSISKTLAEALLLGIIGDTGGFSHVPPTESQVFTLAKELLEIVGVSIGEFRSRYGGIPMNVFPVIQVLMKNTQFISVEGWPDFQYAYLTRTDLEAGNFTDEDMSAASHLYLGSYLPRIEGYSWGFVVTPRTDGTCRVSSRSLPHSVNVRLLHESMSIGGGHDRAAGGSFKDISEPTECIARVLEFMKANKPTLG
jgi:bifunctional oligoribonuclease and PAP phosphatase NrnA